ncbi:hypothetical protein CYMTET_8357 [Cymbomonas tetramitiformis]|nr:hypothetical protein CYMTET_8357 [Cymbomonas tetramitiformis]
MITKNRKVWDASAQSLKEIDFERLNIANDYNHNMNGVDIADQLRDHYRFDGPWMRQRKWWWALFLWGLGVAVVNAYLLYRRQCELRKVPKCKQLSHLEFNSALAEALCGQCKVAASNLFTSSASAAKKRSADGAVKVSGYSPRLTPNLLKRWVSRTVGKHSLLDLSTRVGDGGPCQWCRYRAKNEYDGQAPTEVVTYPKARFGCKECDVWFCGPACWNEFHHL